MSKQFDEFWDSLSDEEKAKRERAEFEAEREYDIMINELKEGLKHITIGQTGELVSICKDMRQNPEAKFGKIEESGVQNDQKSPKIRVTTYDIFE